MPIKDNYDLKHIDDLNLIINLSSSLEMLEVNDIERLIFIRFKNNVDYNIIAKDLSISFDINEESALNYIYAFRNKLNSLGIYSD